MPAVLGFVCLIGLAVLWGHIVLNGIGWFVGSSVADPTKGQTFPIEVGARLLGTVYVSREFQTVYNIFQWGALGFIACFVGTVCVLIFRK